MNKILLVILMFTFINTTYAEECTEAKIKELQQQAEAITIDTEFDYDGLEEQMYRNNFITIQNLTEGFYIISSNQAYIFDYSDNINGKITKIIDSRTEKLYIYNQSCPNKILKEINLSLKTYNQYSELEECKGLEEKVDVCNKFYEGALSEAKFYEKIEEYNKKNNNPTKRKKENKLNLIISIGIIITFVLIIFSIIKRRKRNILN